MYNNKIVHVDWTALKEIAIGHYFCLQCSDANDFTMTPNPQWRSSRNQIPPTSLLTIEST
jgi:hypothetical protein